MTVGEMLRRMTSAELTRWKAYDRLWPLGRWRDEYLLGKGAGLIFNLICRYLGGKDADMVQPQDLMLTAQAMSEFRAKGGQDWKHMKQTLKGLSQQKGAKRGRRRR